MDSGPEDISKSYSAYALGLGRKLGPGFMEYGTLNIPVTALDVQAGKPAQGQGADLLRQLEGPAAGVNRPETFQAQILDD